MAPRNAGMARKVQELEERNTRLQESYNALLARLEAIESNQRRTADTDDDSEEEEENNEEVQEEQQVDPEEQRTLRILKAMKGDSYKVRKDIPMYDGSLKEEDLLDWIASMDAYFESDDIPEGQRVKLAKTKLKGHALLWWDHEEAERRKKGKPKLTSWDRMVSKMKSNFLPKDFEVQMHKKMQGLKQKDLDVKAYTDEFYKLSMRSGLDEEEIVKVARYLGGLKFSIQDEFAAVNPRSVKECYQMALRIEEKLKRRSERHNARGGSYMRGRGRTTQVWEEKDKGTNSDSRGGQNQRGGRSGQGRGSGLFTGTCFTCGKVGHQSYKCPDKEKRVQLIQGENEEEEEVRKIGNAGPETGDFLMFRKGKEWTPQVSIFRTNCLIQGEVYKLVIDSGTCSNLISWDVVNALRLPIQHHPRPYYATWVEDNQNFLVHYQTLVTVDVSFVPLHNI